MFKILKFYSIVKIIKALCYIIKLLKSG